MVSNIGAIKRYIDDIDDLQRKAIRIMNFKSKSSLSKQVFIDSKIMRKSENCL